MACDIDGAVNPDPGSYSAFLVRPTGVTSYGPSASRGLESPGPEDPRARPTTRLPVGASVPLRSFCLMRSLNSTQAVKKITFLDGLILAVHNRVME